MPLQKAPSPRDGGFYWVMPDGTLVGPNYNLRPPFNPTSGFSNEFIGQRIFSKLHSDYIAEALKKSGGGPGGPGGSGGGPGGPGGSGGAGPPPAKQIGIGGYTMDYSDPNTFKKFDATAPMINGYVPFAQNQQGPPQAYGNGPMPMPRYANYPNYQAPAPPPGYPGGMTSQAWQPNVYQAAYFVPGNDWNGYGRGGYYGAYGQNPIVQVQAMQPYGPPPMPMAYAGNYYNQGYANMPGPPCPPYGAMPALPYNMPAYSLPSYPTPAPPNYAMPPATFPPLPNPSYEPPSGPACPPRYNYNPLVRSPRDFFMWGEVQEDRAARARRPMTVPQ